MGRELKGIGRELLPGVHSDFRGVANERPLYTQVREILVDRIGRGEWSGARRLPSEAELAIEYGVSSATIRKAIQDLQARNLVVRRRGDGTYVVSGEHRDLFYFWRIVDAEGTRELPSSEVLSWSVIKASATEARRLKIRRSERVIRIERVRFLAKAPTLLETIVVPYSLFPELGKREQLPNALYRHYERSYGIGVARAVEDLSAVPARKREAEILRVELSTPLLQIDRTAYGFDGRPIEWRLGRCSTRRHVYRNDVT